jgi:hypothetical protein
LFITSTSMEPDVLMPSKLLVIRVSVLIFPLPVIDRQEQNKTAEKNKIIILFIKRF